MYIINLQDRTNGETAVENYASFDTYEEAVEFGNSHEMEFRSCGWMYVVAFVEM